MSDQTMITTDTAPVSLEPAPPPAAMPGPSRPLAVQSQAPWSAATVVDDQDPGQPFRRVFGWVALVAAGVWGLFMGGFLAYHSLQPDDWMLRLVEKQFPAMILVPMSALGSLCIVLLLRLSSGPLEFKALGFEFRGASGQVVLWVVCFIALILSIKLLWVPA
jgi:hypothetical protein